MIHIYQQSRKVASFYQEPDGSLHFVPRDPKTGTEKRFQDQEEFRQFLQGFLSRGEFACRGDLRSG